MLWMLPLSALAAEVAVVGVHDDTRSVDEQTALLTSLEAAVELSGEHSALGGEELQNALGGREELVLEAAFLADGRRLLEDGRILYQQAQPEEALEVLEAGASSLGDGMAVCTSVRDLWETWMLLGTSRLALGQEAGAHEALSYAIALQKDRVPDQATYPPQILEMYRSERELAVSEAGRLTITVSEEIGTATVLVNGVDMGTAPVVLSEVLPGDHYIHVRTEDRLVGFRQVTMGPGGERTARVTAKDPELGVARLSEGGKSQQIAALYRGLGRQSRADLVLLVGRTEEGMRVQLFDSVVDAFGPPVQLGDDASTDDLVAAVVKALSRLDDRGRLLGDDAVHVAVPVDISTNYVLARWLMTPGVDEEPVLPMPVPVDPVDEPPMPPSTRKRWPTYVAVGVGSAVVVGGVTALAVVLGGRGNTTTEPGGTITVGPPQR